MTYQTIVISSRNVKKERNKGNSLFGENLNRSEDVFRIARAEAQPLIVKKLRKKKNGKGKETVEVYTKKPYKLDLIDKAEEASFLQTQVQGYDNGKPWLFFLHGNNQTFYKNLLKSRKIQEEYDANLIIFSWPSRSYDDDMDLALVIALALMVSKNYKLGLATAKKGLERKVKQYRSASRHAGLTVGAFDQSFALLRDQLLLPLQQNGSKFGFLTHSLGHKVLKETITDERQGFNGFIFNGAVLHQADELAVNHSQWLRDFPVANDENVYITRNKMDSTLFLSDLIHNIVPANGQISLSVLKQAIALAYDFLKGNTDDELGSRIGNRHVLSENYGALQAMEFTGLDTVGKKHDVAWNKSVSNGIKQGVKGSLFNV